MMEVHHILKDSHWKRPTSESIDLKAIHTDEVVRNNEEQVTLKHPFTMMVAGPTSCEKTSC